MRLIATLGTALLVTAPTMGLAQNEDSPVDAGRRDLGATLEVFTDQDGATLYARACAGCHGNEGEGAYGAGKYPALAANQRLGSVRYPVNLIIEGNGAMPSFAAWLDDAQIAAIVEHIRTSYGNDYPEAVTAEEIAEMRAAFAELDGG
ncbi:MAG: c-type cytochrome [Paracoccaceae bacterium]